MSRCIRLCHYLRREGPRCNRLSGRVLEKLQHRFLDLSCLSALIRIFSQVHQQEFAGSLPVKLNKRWKVYHPHGDRLSARRTQLHGFPHDHADRPHVALHRVLQRRLNFRRVISYRPNSLHGRRRRKESRDTKVADLVQKDNSGQRSTAHSYNGRARIARQSRTFTSSLASMKMFLGFRSR